MDRVTRGELDRRLLIVFARLEDSVDADRLAAMRELVRAGQAAVAVEQLRAELVPSVSGEGLTREDRR